MREIPSNTGYSRIAFTVLFAGLIVLLAGGVAFAQVSWPVYASSGGSGAINPGGTVYVPDGAAASFTFVPAPGFMVYQVFVDGTAVAGNTSGITLSAVHSQHSISVTFLPVSNVPYDAGVVTGPDLYLFGGGYDRGRDARDFSRRGAESRAVAHSGGGGGGSGGGGGHGGNK